MLDSTCHICIFKPNCSSETNRREFNKLCPLAQLLEHFVAEQHRESRIRSQAPSRHRTRMADEHVPYYRALISGNFRVLTLVSLQRLKMEALIPAPADVEMRSMIKFWMHRDQLCQVYGHTQLDGQHISCRISDGRFLIIIHPEGRTSRPVISIFSYTSRNSCSFREWQVEMSVTVVPIPGGRPLWHRIQKLVSRYDKCLNSGGEYVEKLAQHLLCLFQWIFSLNWGLSL